MDIVLVNYYSVKIEKNPQYYRILDSKVFLLTFSSFAFP